MTIVAILAAIAAAIAALLGAERLGRRAGRLEERARQADARAVIAERVGEADRVIVGETRDAEEEARRLARARADLPPTPRDVEALIRRIDDLRSRIKR